MCLVCFEDDNYPLMASLIVDILSWYTTFWSTVYPWASMKYKVHKIMGNTSSSDTNLDSVELFVLIFYFCKLLMITPPPRDIIVPVWPL